MINYYGLVVFVFLFGFGHKESVNLIVRSLGFHARTSYKSIHATTLQRELTNP